MGSGWLGILKASAWQLLGLSLGLLVFWLLFRFEVLPPTNSPWVVYGLPFAMLIIGGLSIASLFEKVAGLFGNLLQKRRADRERVQKIAKHQKKFVEYLPYATEDERSIYGWLLKNNQKTFAAEMDCGHGASLLKRGFIQSDAINGVPYEMSGFPFSVPDHIWVLLEENRDEFPSEFKDRKRPWFKTGW